MSTATYTVVGMTCAHCVSSVTEEVGEIPGVTGVDVDLSTGTMVVASADDTAVDDDAVGSAVAEAGYEIAN